MMKLVWKLSFIILLLSVLVVWFAAITFPQNDLHIIACDVGQGDAILAVHGNNQILIDGGNGDSVIDCLSRHLPFWDRNIEVVVLSHPQSDHFEGLIEVFKRYDIEAFVASSLDSGSQGYQVLKSLVRGSGTLVINPTTGMIVRSGMIYLDILWPSEAIVDASSSENVLGAFTSARDPNELSVVAILRYEDFEALMTGDIGPGVTDDILAVGKVRDVEYIKIPHHGSKNGLTQNLLDASAPEMAVISVGKNPWGHPHKEILEMLENAAIEIYRTDEMGDVEVVTDGESVWVE